jgi:hypothetical protein
MGYPGHLAVMAHLQQRCACRAAFTVFFVAGLLPAAWSTRIPAITADLDLTEGALAVGIFGLEAVGCQNSATAPDQRFQAAAS